MGRRQQQINCAALTKGDLAQLGCHLLDHARRVCGRGPFPGNRPPAGRLWTTTGDKRSRAPRLPRRHQTPRACGQNDEQPFTAGPATFARPIDLWWGRGNSNPRPDAAISGFSEVRQPENYCSEPGILALRNREISGVSGLTGNKPGIGGRRERQAPIR
jgi:hypothetical protein